VHALQTASVVGVHGVDAKSPVPQTVHALHVSPVPVKPGLHRHAGAPPMSMQNASGLQPPLSRLHALFMPMQTPAEHVSSAPHVRSHAPQFA
jgi:hypothetical protein